MLDVFFSSLNRDHFLVCCILKCCCDTEAVVLPCAENPKCKRICSMFLRSGSQLTHLRPQVPIKNIERELICPICKELFTHPLILPCQHSICHKCVRELLMLNHDDSFDAGSECSMPGSPRSRVPSPSMERLDRLTRSGGSRGKEPEVFCFVLPPTKC